MYRKKGTNERTNERGKYNTALAYQVNRCVHIWKSLCFTAFIHHCAASSVITRKIHQNVNNEFNIEHNLLRFARRCTTHTHTNRHQTWHPRFCGWENEQFRFRLNHGIHNKIRACITHTSPIHNSTVCVQRNKKKKKKSSENRNYCRVQCVRIVCEEGSMTMRRSVCNCVRVYLRGEPKHNLQAHSLVIVCVQPFVQPIHRQQWNKRKGEAKPRHSTFKVVYS